MIVEWSPNLKGLRVDCIVELLSDQLWIDVGIVHPTAPSKLAQTLSFVRQQFIAERVARGNRDNNAFTGFASRPVKTYQMVKDAKYKCMVDVVVNDVKTGKRTRTPRMGPCILSHLGEMSPSALRTIEWSSSRLSTEK